MKKVFRIFLKIVLWYFILSIATVIIYRFVPPPFTPLMVMRLFEQKSEGKELKLKKDWVGLNKISASLPLAVITSEDQKFEEHFGFDLEAIKKAEKYNERHKGKKVKGASTISQQTAKNVFLTSSRSWVRKGFEVYFTFLIEIFWSKERIMEVYLNEIEMGDGIYGVEAASQNYFHKPAKQINNSEAALIAACLPNPRKWSPAKPTAYILRKKNWILSHMNKVDAKDF
jgi:monofunctional biosynthetic peptidoglycan transglycosylase